MGSITKRILLVRHGHHAEVGHVLSGRSAIALSDEGRTQAAAVARYLAATQVDAIYGSPRPRTIETAEAIAASRGLAVQRADALDEVDFGRFAGRRFADLDGDRDWARWNVERATARCLGGETMGEAIDRAAAFLFALGAGTIVCVSHCDIIRGVVAHVLGLPLHRIFSLGCDPASLTRLDFDGQDVRVDTLNEQPWR